MQNHTLEKATAEEEMPIFGEVDQGFTFAPKIVDKQQKNLLAWVAKEQEQKQTSNPGKAPSVVQNMQNENSLPPSPQEPFDDLLQNTTAQSKSSAATSQDVLSHKSNNSDAVSRDLPSQKSNTSPSRHTNPERALAFDTPERRSQRNSQPPPIFDVAQVKQEENKKTGGATQETHQLFPV